MVHLICLANSWKRGERCIAGIDSATGNWIRPVSDLDDGRIPWYIRTINGTEPKLLDILDIPLAEAAPPHWDFERENRSILPGVWQKIGTAQPVDLLPFCSTDSVILHNLDRYISLSYLQALPAHKRQTLQLIYATKICVQKGASRANSKSKWHGTITTNGQSLINASITDPVLVDRLTAGDRPHQSCLVTVSLSLPFCPSEKWQNDDPCWKLIAGVIELSEADLILVEMQRIRWNLERGREYLQQQYGKRSRKQLTASELTQFLTYLKSQPSPQLLTA
jgi:hypothetical protein